MHQLFVDSGALYALADRDDRWHRKAMDFYEESGLQWVTSNLVFVETVSLLTKRAGKHVALRVGEWILGSDSLHVVHVDELLQREAWALFESRRDKEYDLVDCASFVIMERHRITEVFSFDRHFSQAGFRMLPGS